MDLKKSLLSILASAALVAPAAAFAEHDEWRDRDRDRHEHRHSEYCEHRPAPRDAHGRYELRTISNWVEGRWVRDYVPGKCVQRGRHGRVKCREGHYVDRWVPGYYEETQQWVWVPYVRRPGWQVSVRY